MFISIEKCKYISNRNEEECLGWGLGPYMETCNGGGSPLDPDLDPQPPVLAVCSFKTWFRISNLTKMEVPLHVPLCSTSVTMWNKVSNTPYCHYHLFSTYYTSAGDEDGISLTMEKTLLSPFGI